MSERIGKRASVAAPRIRVAE